MATSKKIKKINRKARLRKAKDWVSTYKGADIVGAYGKRFKVDPICAQRDLEAMNASTPEQRKELKQAFDIRKKKEREEKVTRLEKKMEKRKIAYENENKDPRVMQQVLKEVKAATPKKKNPKRRCENCGAAMKQQFIQLKHCKCGTSWSKEMGYFTRTANMVFALQRKVTKKRKNSIRTKQVPIIRIKSDES